MPNDIPGDWTKGALQKAIISATEGTAKGKDVTVKFNPKELTFDKPVPWQKHKNAEGDAPTLEFTSAEPQTLACELMFDLYEELGNVYDAYVSKLESFAFIDTGLKRPPLIEFNWGTMKTFKGVIEDLNVKYTLFLPDGTPCRATVNLKMKQATELLNKQQKEERDKADAEAEKAAATANAAQTSSSGAQASQTMNNQAAGGSTVGPTGATTPPPTAPTPTATRPAGT